MKQSSQKAAPLLDNAVDLMFRIHMMRGDCCAAARTVLQKKPSDFLALEEYARLEEALAKSYRTLQHTLRGIQRSRSRRGKAAGN